MTAPFADTSVLLYAISRDPAEQDKAKRANDILAERDLALPGAECHARVRGCLCPRNPGPRSRP